LVFTIESKHQELMWFYLLAKLKITNVKSINYPDQVSKVFIMLLQDKRLISTKFQPGLLTRAPTKS
jgi:hypothetical protein